MLLPMRKMEIATGGLEARRRVSGAPFALPRFRNGALGLSEDAGTVNG